MKLRPESMLKQNNTFDTDSTNHDAHHNKRKSIVWVLCALTSFAVIGGIIGALVLVLKKDEDSAIIPKNYMSCDSSKASDMAGFSMMPMNSIDMTDDMMTKMDSMHLQCMGDDEVYRKMKSEMRTMEDGETETVWVGVNDRMGFATLVQTPDGMAGSFTTSTATYSLMQAPDGTMQMKTILWADLPDEGDSKEETLTMALNDTTSMERMTPPAPPNKVINTVVDEVDSPTANGPSRFLRQSRQLQTSNIRVLLLVTNRAMCENAGLRAGCTLTSFTRTAFSLRVPILVSQTNTAMQGVRVDAQIEIVDTIFLSSSYDPDPDSATLTVLRTNPTVARWRSESRADLVAIITGSGSYCGLATVGGFVSATSHLCLDGYTFTHEVYVEYYNIL